MVSSPRSGPSHPFVAWRVGDNAHPIPHVDVLAGARVTPAAPTESTAATDGILGVRGGGGGGGGSAGDGSGITSANGGPDEVEDTAGKLFIGGLGWSSTRDALNECVCRRRPHPSTPHPLHMTW
jgi:hypothetical protein